MGTVHNYNPVTPQLDAGFANYLSSKSVAIVGRSGIHDLEQGEFIDSHDAVVRIHWAVPLSPLFGTPTENVKSHLNDPVQVGQFVPAEWHRIVGKRVDILYHRLRNNNPAYVAKWCSALDVSGIKFVCCDSMHHQDSYADAYAQQYMNVRYVSWELRGSLITKLHETPDAGIVCICDVLSHDIRSAYITGFPCFFDKDIDADLPHAQQNKRPRLKALQFLNDLGKDSRVSFDSVMSGLFEQHCKG